MTFVWLDDAVLPQWKERGANPRLGLGQAQKKIMEKLDAGWEAVVFSSTRLETSVLQRAKVRRVDTCFLRKKGREPVPVRGPVLLSLAHRGLVKVTRELSPELAAQSRLKPKKPAKRTKKPEPDVTVNVWLRCEFCDRRVPQDEIVHCPRCTVGAVCRRCRDTHGCL